MPTFHQVKLDQKPCNVQYLDEFDSFLVGTYQLYPTLEDAREKFGPKLTEVASLQDHLDKINQRAGKFCIIRFDYPRNEAKVEFEYDCVDGGGVFDTVLCDPLDGSINERVMIYAAHSNGTIGHYDLSMTTQRSYNIVQKNLIRVSGAPSTLLTSIALIGEQRLVVGDSLGTLSVVSITEGRILAQEKIADCETIWKVAALDITKDDRCMILVGGENCTWYAYQYTQSTNSITLVYKNQNKDFQAGITSIAYVHDETSNGICTRMDILIGSYDESIQSYSLKLDLQRESLSVSVDHRGKISVPGGGIWRIKPVQFYDNHAKDMEESRLLVSAMYAGTFSVDMPKGPEAGELSSAPVVKKLVDVDKMGLPSQPLHYDVDVSYGMLVMCIADFNNSLCLLAPLRKRNL